MKKSAPPPPENISEAISILSGLIAGETEPSFRALVEAAGLDPARDFTKSGLRDLDLRNEDLRGFDFTDADVSGSDFRGADVAGVSFFGADVTGSIGLPAGIERVPPRRRRVLRDFETFRDAPFAPEMVALPAGTFWMGSDLGDREAFPNERIPQIGKRQMRIARPFALGKYPVTFDEYDAFCAATQRKQPGDEGWGRGNRPVVNVSHDDAMAYVGWLNASLGIEAWRLPSEAEWEYACRAGTATRRWWGDWWHGKWANGDRSFEVSRTSKGRTLQVDRHGANPWGLHDMIGNVWEWCADIYVESIGDLPGGGLPLQSISNPIMAKFPMRSLRGGAWDNDPRFLRTAVRVAFNTHVTDATIGFRVAITINP